MNEIDKVCHLLLSLPEEFSPVITGLETVPEVKMDFVRARLLDEVSFKAQGGCFI